MRENIEIERGSAEEERRGAISVTAGAADRVGTWKSPAHGDAIPARSPNEPTTGTPVIGYASCVRTGSASTRELKEQASVIERECKDRGLRLLEVVAEREPATGKALTRPGLTYALERLSSGEAQGLVVAELSRITCSAAEIGTIMEWLAALKVRFVAVAQAFDTESADGRLAANMLVEVSRWERIRLRERTRNGLQAARMNGKTTGRPAVTDDPDLSERISQMRAQGMTLQAIADQLNDEGVPTVRGGAKWRHSSVQAAAGYRRRESANGALMAPRQLLERRAS